MSYLYSCIQLSVTVYRTAGCQNFRNLLADNVLVQVGELRLGESHLVLVVQPDVCLQQEVCYLELFQLQLFLQSGLDEGGNPNVLVGVECECESPNEGFAFGVSL